MVRNRNFPYQYSHVVVLTPYLIPFLGKLCGAFLVDSAFERWVKAKSGLKFDDVDEKEFRAFLQGEWEYTMKRAFSGKENQNAFAIRPPSKAMKKAKVKIKGDSFPISK